MIIDTSALVAIVKREPGYPSLLDALLTSSSLLPTPVSVEFARVTALADNRPNPASSELLARLLAGKMRVIEFDVRSADAAVAANANYGSGNGAGGKLNMLDLMVYGVARVTGLPILCTGRDFAATDALIHPASRTS